MTVRGLPPWYVDLAPPAIGAITLTVTMAHISMPWWWVGSIWVMLAWSAVSLVRSRLALERQLREMDAIMERHMRELGARDSR